MISRIKWTKEDQVEQLVKDTMTTMEKEFNTLMIEVTT